MKNLLLMLALVSSQFVKAATYYFSTISGDDARSAVQAQNPLTPWKSLARLNTFMSSLQPGDSILFHRGEIFYGQIRVSQSGNSSNKIIFAAYGSGNNPIISGFFSPSSWTNNGGGIWETSCSSCGNIVNAVNIDGNNKAMGRYPNYDATNKGYLKFESHSSNTQITDNELTNSPNWTGAEIVIRKNYWTLDRNYVTQHTNGTVTFISPTGHPLLDNYGYFFQNHLQTLDRNSEWFYDGVQKKLKVYFGAGGPGSSVIRIGSVDTLVNITSRNHLLFLNLNFEGADTTAFAINNATNVRIQNCNFLYSGIDAINARNSHQVVIESCSFEQTNNNAVRITDCNYSEVRNSSIRNTGLMAGMGLSNNQMYEAIYARGTSNTIEYNEVINTGYSAITFAGEQAIVRNNFIENYTMVLDDGGGIYGWGDYDKFGRIISNNIILNGIGAPEGTDVTVAGNSSGIYLDDRSANVEISNNTVANANRAGVYLHNSHEIVLRNNTLFNNSCQVAMVHDDLEPADPIRNVTMQQNIFFSKTDKQSVSNSASRQNDIGQFGNYSNNYYVRPMDQQGIIQTDYRNGSGEYINQRYNLPAWKSVYSNDVGSLPAPLALLPYLINNTIGGNRFSNGGFNSNINGVFCMSSPGACVTSWNSGGHLDGGALEIKASGAATNIATHISIGPVQAGKNYLIKFSLIGSTANQTVGAYLLKNGAPYNALSEKKYFSLGTTRTENEFMFSSPTTESDVYLIFTISQGQQPFWVDNLDVREANASITNPDDFIRFEYNRTNAPRTVLLDAAYVDAKNIPYLNLLVLPPFSSVVLIRTGAVLPMKFLDVDVMENNEYAEIKWSVSQQDEIEYFEIEKSHEGIQFIPLNIIVRNNNNSTGNYKVADSSVKAGNNCYRIKAVKKTGGFVYSSTKCIRPKALQEVSIFPNPVVNELNIRLTGATANEKIDVVIRDSKGAVHRSFTSTARNNKLSIDVSTITNGAYFLYVKTSKQVYTKAFLVQGK